MINQLGLCIYCESCILLFKDMYSGHNGGATSASNSTTKSRKPRGQNAITDIVDPTTGKNISHEIYKDNETIQSGESSNRDTPQPQVSNIIILIH